LKEGRKKNGATSAFRKKSAPPSTTEFRFWGKKEKTRGGRGPRRDCPQPEH